MQSILKRIARLQFLRGWRQQRIVTLVRRGACVAILATWPATGPYAQDMQGCSTTSGAYGGTGCEEPAGFFGKLKCWAKEKEYDLYLERQHKHPKFHYPIVSPYCSPTYGYHETCWRKMPPSNAHCPCPSPMIEYVPATPPTYATPEPAPVETTPMPMPVEPAQEYSPLPDAAPAEPAPMPEVPPIAPPMPAEPLKKAEVLPQWRQTRQLPAPPTVNSQPVASPPVEIRPIEVRPAEVRQAPMPPQVKSTPAPRPESTVSITRLAPRTALDPVACHPVILVEFEMAADADQFDPRLLFSSKGTMPDSPKATRPLQPRQHRQPRWQTIESPLVTSTAAVVQLESTE